ncbi:MAG: 4-oxalocrotonate tautomerase [Acidimicrobiaceae bacterium]
MADDAVAVTEAATKTKETAMPLINVKVMENVLSDDQKRELATRFTDTFADVVGEAARPLTWVIVEDIRTGQLVIGGDSITTEAVKDLLAQPQAVAASR